MKLKSVLPLNRLTWLAIGSLFPLNLLAQQALPDLGAAQATNVDNQPVASATTFAGGVSVNALAFLKEDNIDVQKPAKIVASITVDPKDVGQIADIVVYVSFANLDNPGNPALFMLDENGEVFPWDFDPLNLVPFIPQVELQSTQQVDIYNSQLPEGKLQIFFGYLLADALIVNQQPLDIAVEAIPSIIQDVEVEEPEFALEIDTTPMLSEEADRLVGQLGVRWPIGAVLKVGFDFTEAQFEEYPSPVCLGSMAKEDCENAVAEQVITYASEWSQYGNLYFKKAAWDHSDIRIRFRELGSYSYIGTNAKGVSRDQHTLNLALSFLQTDRAFKRTVIHEFGHAIGLHHEHISPNIAYTWNEEQIIADMQERGWSADKTRSNIIDNLLSRHSKSAFLTTKFDPLSIMIYPIAKKWVSKADLADPERCPAAETTDYYCVKRGDELSERDKQGIAQFYPRREKQGNGCSMTYDPRGYQAGTPNWDGHSGQIVFNNPTHFKLKVNLYHPETLNRQTWHIAAKKRARLFSKGTPFEVNMAWGIQVGDSPICILKTVSAWEEEKKTFQTSTSYMPGL